MIPVKNWLFLFIFAATVCSFSQEWQEPIMPVSEVRPGMRGFLKTVYYGDKIDQVDVEIIEVMHNYYPKRDVILARLLGEKAEQAGVVSGMSGSPVYIDGKLIGALAYRFGEFMKDPIAGITPIESMTEIMQLEASRPAEQTSLNDATPRFLQAALTGADDNFWPIMLSSFDKTEPSAGLSRISCPLIFSGFEAATLQQVQPLFRELGFTPMVGGGTGSPAKTSPILSPGSAVSIVFISGDYSIEATGTVTAVQGTRLLAFGHQLFNFGPIRLPLAGADIYATLPSLSGSSKMASATGVVGTFLQDRLSGALGDLSLMPKMIPVSLTVESPYHAAQKYAFQMADDPSFNNLLPFFLRTALLQGVYAARLAGEQNSSYLNGEITLSDGRTVPLNDFFTSRQSLGFLAAGTDATDATDLVTTLLGALMVNDFQGPQVKEINLSLKTVPGKNYAVIESVWLDKTVVRAGESIELTVTLRDNLDKTSIIKKTIAIPKNLEGNRLSLLVSSAASLSNYEIQMNRSKFVPQDFNHLLSLINERRKPQNLYIQLRTDDDGMFVEGRELTELPPSVTAVMNTRAARGFAANLRDRVVFEEAVTCDQVIQGAQRLLLLVKASASARSPEPNNNQFRF
jgi:hypothetical protein